MAIFSLSPSVEVKETDLTLIVPAVATSIGAFSGVFQWGPVNEAIVVDSEKTLVSLFGQPDKDTARDFLTAASFLSYSNNLRLVRVVGAKARNAHHGGTAPLIENAVDHEAKVSGLTDVKFIAKFPGTLGNSLRVSFADSATFEKWEFRHLFGSAVTVNKVATLTNEQPTITFTSPNTTANLAVGMSVSGTGIKEGSKIKSVDSATQITLDQNAESAQSDAALVFTTYSGAPSTTASVASKGGKDDEIHLVVIDEKGAWSGTAGTVLERYQGLSKANNAKDQNGATAYYAEVLNRNSKYVWFGGKHEKDNWGGDATQTFNPMDAAFNQPLTGGVSDNGDEVTVGQRIRGYEVFSRAESIDVSLVIVAGLNGLDDQKALANYVLDNVTSARKDCIALLSPNMTATVNNKDNELQGNLNFRNAIGDTSYGVLCSAWKQMYDRYNDQIVWVPLSGDLAGLCAHTDQVADPWFSPAGFNRGFLKNVLKLSYNPGSKAERDTLYQAGINPVTSQVGEGVVLFGDKTLQRKPSAFDRINVRRLFIVLEKSISTAAKNVLFEVNDEFTRNRFIGMVEPFLREVQGRRGMYDHRVVCDETNNTPEVIDSNGFVGDIFIKPSKSINAITLNFVATPTGVSFDEVS